MGINEEMSDQTVTIKHPKTVSALWYVTMGLTAVGMYVVTKSIAKNSLKVVNKIVK